MGQPARLPASPAYVRLLRSQLAKSGRKCGGVRAPALGLLCERTPDSGGFADRRGEHVLEPLAQGDKTGIWSTDDRGRRLGLRRKHASLLPQPASLCLELELKRLGRLTGEHSSPRSGS